MVTYDEFRKVEMRVGKILSVADFPEARNPAYKFEIDFGKYGIKRSSAQAKNYSTAELKGRLIVAVTNFPEKQIANFMSEALVMGVDDKKGKLALLGIDTKNVKLGTRVY